MATVQQITQFFLYLQKELQLASPSLKQVFSLTGMAMADNKIITRVLSSFEKNGLPREMKPPEWNLALVLESYSSTI